MIKVVKTRADLDKSDSLSFVKSFYIAWDKYDDFKQQWTEELFLWANNMKKEIV